MINNRKELIIQFIKFNLVGIVNTGLTYLVFSGIFFLTRSNLWALIFDYGFGILFSFFVNRHFTFKAASRDLRTQLLKMIITYVVLFFINYGLLWYLTESREMNTYLAQFGALIVITLLSFINQRVIVFRKTSSHLSQ